MINKDVYNNYIEQIALILEYHDNVNKIYEYCESVIDRIVHGKTNTSEKEWDRATKTVSSRWWREYREFFICRLNPYKEL